MRILERKTRAYEIQGDNLEILKVCVDSQLSVFAEAGKMIYVRGNVRMDSRMPETASGGGFLGKVMGAGKRMLAGESLFSTHYEGQGEVGFAGDFPGRILAIGLSNQSILAQRDAFIAAMGNVDISIAVQKRIGGALFGGEGFILEKLSGDGLVFIHAGGDLFSFDLAPNETIRVDTGSAVAWDASVQYDVRMMSSVRSALFGGEGLFLTTLTGPGTVVLQTMTLAKLRRQIGRSVGKTEAAEPSLVRGLGIGGLGAAAGGILGGILGSEDDES
ncbi:MAG: TIGR00266 family protein [Syntrophobacteraceae bacterium CG07_land_8_20_14_0_80_61_8]|nr:MAG: TIGR00266 family protein [Syntrophobacteraceae bacterium CG07_land_8_20_14_0_80_61_8]